jgi:hypothetical protein
MISSGPTSLLRDFVIGLFEDKKNFTYVHKTKEANLLNELVLE